MKLKSPKAQRPGSLYHDLMPGLLYSCPSVINLIYIHFRWPFYFSCHKKVKSVILHLLLDPNLQKTLHSHFWHHFSPTSEIIMYLSSATHTDERNLFCLHPFAVSGICLSPENTTFLEAISSGGCFLFHSLYCSGWRRANSRLFSFFVLAAFSVFSYLRPQAWNPVP